MIVEPAAGDRVEDNLNPVGPGLLRVLHPALHAQLAVPGGRARARHPGRPGPDPRRRRRAAGFTTVPHGRRDAVQQRLRGTPVTPRPAGAATPVGVRRRRDGRGRWPGRRRRLRRRTGRPTTVLLLPTWSDHRLPVLEGAGRLPGPALPGRDVRRARAAAARAGRRARRRTPNAECAADVARRDGRHRAPTGPCWWRCPAARAWAVHVAAEHPDRVLGVVAIGAVVRARRRPARAGRSTRGTPGCDTTRGLGEVQQALLARRRLRRLRRVLLRARCSPSRTRRSRSRTASEWAREIVAADPGRHHRRPARLRRRGVPAARAGCAPGCGARCSSSTAPTTGSARPRSASGWPS